MAGKKAKPSPMTVSLPGSGAAGAGDSRPRGAPGAAAKAPAAPSALVRPGVAGWFTRAASRPWFVHGGAVLFFTLLSLVMTWPLALHMADSVVGEIGDNIYFIFLIRWYERAWFELGISPFFHPWLNYPQGWNLASTDTSLATTLFGLPASMLFGPTFGYNFAMLVTFVLSGWAMFAWVRRLTGSALAGLVGGAIYAFLPSRMAHFLIGHMNLSGTAWFPLYFMGLHELLGVDQARSGVRATWKPLLFTALALGLIGFTSMYYLYMTLLITPVFAAAYLWFAQRKELADLRFWRGLALRFAVLAVISLPLVVLAVLPFLGLESQGGLASRSVSYASMYSASPTDYILPSTDHFLFGRWVGEHFDRSLWIEATFYVGAVALALAVLAWLNRREGDHAALIKAALVVILVAFILSLGTDFHWNNQRVEIPLPGFLQSALGRESTPIPLPAYLLFQYLPFYAKMRALMRIGIFVLIFSTLLAGLGAAWLLRWVEARRARGQASLLASPLAVTALLLALVFFDFYPGPYTAFDRIEARPVDYWLAEQPGQGAVAQFPFIQAEDQDQVYNTLIHQKPYVGGFFSANQPEQYLRIRPVLEAFPSQEGADLLRDLGVQWVLLDTRQYADFATVRAQLEGLGLRYLDTIGDEAVFELP